MGRRSLSGSPIGGITETQEMLDFCGEHNITADVEVIPIQKVNEAYEPLLKYDVKNSYSIDMDSLTSERSTEFGSSYVCFLLFRVLREPIGRHLIPVNSAHPDD